MVSFNPIKVNISIFFIFLIKINTMLANAPIKTSMINKENSFYLVAYCGEKI